PRNRVAAPTDFGASHERATVAKFSSAGHRLRESRRIAAPDLRPRDDALVFSAPDAVRRATRRRSRQVSPRWTREAVDFLGNSSGAPIALGRAMRFLILLSAAALVACTDQVLSTAPSPHEAPVPAPPTTTYALSVGAATGVAPGTLVGYSVSAIAPRTY